jgi:hypothetical protein
MLKIAVTPRRNFRKYLGPRGPCFAGPRGGLYAGPGGGLYGRPGGGLYAGPGGGLYEGPGDGMYAGPGGGLYTGPGGGLYSGPSGGIYPGPPGGENPTKVPGVRALLASKVENGQIKIAHINRDACPISGSRHGPLTIGRPFLRQAVVHRVVSLIQRRCSRHAGVRARRA